MQKVPVHIKKLRENAMLPRYGSAEAAGADLYACLEAPVEIAAGGTAMVPTGLAMELPEGTAGLVYARSGLASKKGLAPANKVGVIDSDYTGELICLLCNNSDEPYTIRCGDRIAQLVVLPVAHASLQVVEEFDQTARADGGFGSTGR